MSTSTKASQVLSTIKDILTNNNSLENNVMGTRNVDTVRFTLIGACDTFKVADGYERFIFNDSEIVSKNGKFWVGA